MSQYGGTPVALSINRGIAWANAWSDPICQLIMVRCLGLFVCRAASSPILQQPYDQPRQPGLPGSSHGAPYDHDLSGQAAGGLGSSSHGQPGAQDTRSSGGGADHDGGGGLAGMLTVAIAVPVAFATLVGIAAFAWLKWGRSRAMKDVCLCSGPLGASFSKLCSPQSSALRGRSHESSQRHNIKAFTGVCVCVCVYVCLYQHVCTCACVSHCCPCFFTTASAAAQHHPAADSINAHTCTHTNTPCFTPHTYRMSH